MSYKKEELLIVFAPGFFVGSVLFILLVFVLSYYMSLRSGSMLWCPLRFPH